MEETDDVLPFEDQHVVPEYLIADFTEFVEEVEEEKKKNIVQKMAGAVVDGVKGVVDGVKEKIFGKKIPTGWGEDEYFNDLEQAIPRDNEHKVSSQEDLIQKVNRYGFNDTPSNLRGLALSALTCGCYYWGKRTIIPAGKFGHYISSGRHKLTKPGIHALLSPMENWDSRKQLVEIGGNPSGDVKEILGSKVVLTVPENEMAGAFRVGGETKLGLKEFKMDPPKRKDGEFVLFRQGRYVLTDWQYKNIVTCSLTKGAEGGQEQKGSTIVTLGPVKILYVKEGYLGGAFKVYEGVYKVFPPGPPYILHEKEYTDVKLVARNKQIFKLGPLYYVTVREGKMAGAFNMLTGEYQVLGPGNTYRLHTKEYEKPQLVNRAKYFQLGPVHFLTVQKGWIAGVYKKKGGKFISLPPGASYQMNEEEYEQPIFIKRNRHLVRCGPLSYLTVKKGTLAGGYRVADGQFVEFKESKEPYVLHETEYHSLVSINKYKFKMVNFGPMKVITVPDGKIGVFENAGVLETRNSGFYRLSAKYALRALIPIVKQTTTVERIRFKAKDGVEMSITATLVWQITEPEVTALYPQGFEKLKGDISFRFRENLKKYSKRYSRERLLPTKQDVLIRIGDTELDNDQIMAMLRQDLQVTAELYRIVEKNTAKELMEASALAKWGAEVSTIKIGGYKLLDRKISDILEAITIAVLHTTEERVKGKNLLEKANQRMRDNVLKETVRSALSLKQELAKKELQVIKANGEAEVMKVRALSKAEVAIIKVKARTEGEKLTKTTGAEADAEARQIKLDIVNEEIIESAKANAEAIKAVALANYTKAKKENEAQGMMTKYQFELAMADKGVESMAAMGKAAWRMPDKVLEFYENFRPLVSVDQGKKKGRR